MTIGILRRLFQILLLLGALALLLAIPRALAPAAATRQAEPRVESGVRVAPEPRPQYAPAAARLVPTVRAWRMALAALATTAVIALPAALLALFGGTLAGGWAARSSSTALRSIVAALG